MNKLMMTAASVALMAFATPVLAQTASPSTSTPAVSAPAATPSADATAPMTSKDSTSAVAPAVGTTQSSDSMGSGDSATKPTKAAHKMHHAKAMETTKASGSKATDNDAEQLNRQELGKLQQSN